jgi:hypothetical protein
MGYRIYEGLPTLSLHRSVRSAKVHTGVTEVMAGFAEDVVIQYHPTKSEYVNLHDNCLHMWRPVEVEIPTPPKELVG